MTVVHLSEPDAGCGCYVNYPDANLHNWRFLYYKENHDQLQQAKAHWDPLNVFNVPCPVEPPRAMVGDLSP